MNLKPKTLRQYARIFTLHKKDSVSDKPHPPSEIEVAAAIALYFLADVTEKAWDEKEKSELTNWVAFCKAAIDMGIEIKSTIRE